MPGTRNRKGSTAIHDTPAKTSDENSGASQTKKHKKNSESGEPSADESKSSPPVTQQRGRKGQAVAAEGDGASSKPSTERQRQVPEAADKPAPAASPRKRGRPRKAEKDVAGVASGDKAEMVKSEQGDQPAASASIMKTDEKSVVEEDGGERTAPPQPKPLEPSSGEVFSPRRSSRGVVPNRRFQDMELDFGRKRSREESSDESGQKRVRTPGKTERGSKEQRTALKKAAKGKSGTVMNKDVDAEMSAAPNAGHAETTHGQSPAVLAQSAAVPRAAQRSSAAGQLSPSLASPPLSSPSAQQPPVSAPAVFLGLSRMVRAPAPPAGKSQPLPKPPTTSSLLSSTSTPRPPVVVVSSTPAWTPPAAMATRTVAITSSRAVRVHTGAQLEESVTNEAAAKKTLPAQGSAMPVKDSAETATSAGETAPLSADDSAESDASGVVGLADGASVVEVAVVSGQPGGRPPRVVNISSMGHSLVTEKGKVATEPPGRVVGKQQGSEASSVSKSVFIVRNPASQSTSVMPASSAGAGSGKLTTVTMVAKEAGVGDVMSMVEVSANKKVPVVLAERKELAAVAGKVMEFVDRKKNPAAAAGKVVKVISAQQVHQLPPALQKIVTSQMMQQRSPKQLSSPSSSSLESLPPEQPSQQTPKMMTVHVTASSLQHSSAQRIIVNAEQSPAKPSQQSDMTSKLTDMEVSVEDQSSSDSDPAKDQPGTSSGESQPAHSQIDGHPTHAATTSMTPTSSIATTTTTSTDTDGKDGTNLPGGSSRDSQTRSQATGSSKKVFFSSLSDEEEDEDEDEDEDDDESEEEEGIPVSGKYTTSGTQTPYTKSNARRVITVHVHPPSKQGEKNREVVTVTKVEKEDGSGDVIDADEKEAILRHELGADKGKFIVVDLPEGSTITQQFVRTAERYDSDPNFYTVDEQGMFTCTMCPYQTYRRPNFYKHKKKHLVAGLRPYPCDQCQYRAATSSNLKRHQEIHRDIRNHNCHLCNLNFRQKIHLERHIKYRHEEKKVKCPLCDYVCANENPDLKVHIKRRHVPQTGSEEAMNAFKCPECGIVATSKRDLRQHLKFHNKGPELKLFCNMCSFVTDCESRLRRHHYIHTKEKPFQCGLCTYRGSQKEHVLRHMRTQHQIEISRKHRNKKLSSERSWDGEGSKVMERADYTSEEKIFACNHCTMKFSKLINLYKHLHTQHRDIMPSEQEEFSCVVCDFHTSNKKNLLVHMRRHNVTDQSPPSHVYSCVLCRYMNPKRRNLFQHMRKKHHIEIMMRDDGSTTCYMASDPVSTNTSVASALPLSPQQASHSADSMVNVLPLSDLISTVSQPTDLQVSGETGGITASSSSVAPTIKMEDLALVVSNPHSSQGSGGDGEGGVLVEAGAVETITIGALSQDDAAEAIQGLQALAQRGVLEAGAVVEEQVQVMGSDEQTTLVIDPASLGVVVQPKAEPMEVVEIGGSQLLDQVTSTAIISQEEMGILGDAAASSVAISDGLAAASVAGDSGMGLQLSAEQLMNLTTGDYLQINGEMYKVEVSTESNPDGSQGQQIISFEPAEVLPEQLEQPEVSLETTELS